MAVSNSLAKAPKKSIASYLAQEDVKGQMGNVVGVESIQRFTTSVVSAVTANPMLAECSHQTIISAALVGEALKLSPSPQLGHYYLVPYNDKMRGKVAQFQIGYKGYIQLALRSGYYKRINVLALKEGELVSYNPLTEEIIVNIIEYEEAREKAKTTGYYAMFELLGGFTKALYWSRDKMEKHALKYSTGYASDRRKNTSYTFWSKDFDGMAYKTLLRQLISKWGIMSIEMQKAYESDMGLIREDSTVEYIDNDSVTGKTKNDPEYYEPIEVESTEPITVDKVKNSFFE